MNRAKLLGFVAAGAVGFLVDAGVLQGLTRLMGVEPHVARLLSFLAASATTWRINRRYTFQNHGARTSQLREWLRYLWSSAAGGLVNYAVFCAVIAFAGAQGSYPVLGVAVGSLAGMCVNYLLYSRYVFRSSSRHEQ